MKRSLLLVPAFCCACAHGPSLTVGDAELATLGGRGLEQVEAARKDEEAARQNLERSKAEREAASREVAIAEYAIKREEADLAVARLRFEAAQQTRNADAMLPANNRRAQAERALVTAQAESRFREAARALCEAQVDQADAEHVLALSALERAKLAALYAGVDALTPEQEERRASFDVQLAKAQASVATEKSAVAKARAAMQAAQSEWEALTKAAPAPAAAAVTP